MVRGPQMSMLARQPWLLDNSAAVWLAARHPVSAQVYQGDKHRRHVSCMRTPHTHVQGTLLGSSACM